MFWTRLLSGIILVALIIAGVAFGDLPLVIFSCVVGLVGLYEFYRLEGLQRAPGAFVCYAATVVYYLNIIYLDDEYTMQILATLTLLTAALYVLQYPKRRPSEFTHLVFGFIYVVLMFSFLLRVRHADAGSAMVWLIFIAAWGCDTMAYLAGLLFGRHKLTPQLSPKKTVEGAVGGVVGAVGLSYLYIFLLEKFSFGGLRVFTMRTYVMAMTIVFCASVFSQFGDLFASSLKRAKGVKDFGRLIPGHGGILDRFDSILFTAPAVYIILTLFLGFGR
ncbi:MAG: phosphatidate cytidylyltransferase [Eubacteriales bacterium]|nr:phosphatidate cytidylyltransferase [Eubacteriales bacterium]